MRGSEFTVHGPSLSMQIHYYYLVQCVMYGSRQGYECSNV